MKAYRVEKIISQDGFLQLDALPFQAGEKVEVFVLPISREKVQENKGKNFLKGKVLKYIDPTEPVAQEDWEVFSGK